ncbi:MAG: hypothetical protein Q9Q13_03140, partial [Acidobacteriota bacterium]|nr:hypothetical protein [Acidobacteriota bacterium]
ASKKRVSLACSTRSAGGTWTAPWPGLEAIPGPTGEMLRVGVEHAAEPRELVEEVMYEKMLDTRLRLQRFLWFIRDLRRSARLPCSALLSTVVPAS